MKKTFWLHFTACVTALYLCLSVLSTQVRVFPASAVEKDTFGLSICNTETGENSFYISKDTLSKGDYSINLGVYIHAEPWEEEFQSVRLKWIADQEAFLSFNNIIDYFAYGEEQTYEFSGGTITSVYPMYCLANIVKRRNGYRYSSPNCIVSNSMYACDAAYGADLFYEGDNTVSFTATYYNSAEDVANKNKTTKKFICPLQYTNDEKAYFSYDYIRQDNYELDTMTINLYANRERISALNPGDKIPDRSDMIIWYNTTGSGLSFVGESDEFPFTTFQLIIDQDTPVGTYHISLDSDNCLINAKHHAVFLDDFTIEVGDQPETTTTTTTTTLTTTTTTMTTTAEPITTTTEAATSTATTTTTPNTTTTTLNTTTITTSTTTTSTTMVTTETTTTTTITTTIPIETTTVETTTVLPDPYLSSVQKNMVPGELASLWLCNGQGMNIKWSSSNENVIKILSNENNNSIQIWAQNPGTARINAYCKGHVYRCSIVVESDTIALTPLTLTIPKDISVQLKVNNANLTNYISWVSMNSNVACVNNNGVVTGKNGGETMIYAYVGLKKLCCKLTVLDQPYLMTGDVNLDNDVSLADLIKLYQHLCGIVDLNQAAALNAKCEYLRYPQEVTDADGAALRKYLLRIECDLPLQITP